MGQRPFAFLWNRSTIDGFNILRDVVIIGVTALFHAGKRQVILSLQLRERSIADRLALPAVSACLQTLSLLIA
jgi:hypothetical protein